MRSPLKTKRVFRFVPVLWLKTRRHRPQRDDEGKSLRRRCFECFDAGTRPVQVATELSAKRSTVLTYWKQWKRFSPRLHDRYDMARDLKRRTSGAFPSIAVRDTALELDLSEEEVLRRLQQPWGLKRLIDGSIGDGGTDPVRAKANEKLARLMQHVLVYHHLGTQPERIIDKLREIGVVFLDVPPKEPPEA